MRWGDKRQWSGMRARGREGGEGRQVNAKVKNSGREGEIGKGKCGERV